MNILGNGTQFSHFYRNPTLTSIANKFFKNDNKKNHFHYEQNSKHDVGRSYVCLAYVDIHNSQQNVVEKICVTTSKDAR